MHDKRICGLVRSVRAMLEWHVSAHRVGGCLADGLAAVLLALTETFDSVSPDWQPRR